MQAHFLQETKQSYSQETFENMLVEFLSKKCLPFNFFEDEICINLFSYINKNVILPQRNLMRNKVLEKFHLGQKNIASSLQNNAAKVSFTIDGWSSITSNSYYGVTIHFINENWKLVSFVLDFIPARGKHRGGDIANIFCNVLNDYHIDAFKIEGITTDNTSSNFTFTSSLEEKISFDKENQHFVCFAHIINLGVQDFLNLLKLGEHDYVNTISGSASDSEIDNWENYDDDLKVQDPATATVKIRLLAKKIKVSEQILEKFKACCQTANVTFLKPVLDIKTRWNSSLDMINWAIKMKTPINLLCENNEDFYKFTITSNEWNLIHQVFNYLKPFKTISNLLSGEKYPSISMVVITINALLDKLEKWAFELDKENRDEIDEQIIMALQSARNKILKHYNKTNWIYCVALILDPRHKLDSFNLTQWGQDMKQTAVSKFENIYKNCYYKQNLNQLPDYSRKLTEETTHDDFDIDISYLFQKADNRMETHDWKEEINKYLETNRADEDEDILLWWWKNEKNYPCLSAMAKDIFSIMATSVPSERCFSKANLIITKLRNRLNYVSSRSLLCLNSWYTNKIIA